MLARTPVVDNIIVVMLVRSYTRRALGSLARPFSTTTDTNTNPSGRAWSTTSTGVFASFTAAVAATVFLANPSRSYLEQQQPPEPPQPPQPPQQQHSQQLLDHHHLPADASLAWRRRYFFKYERRLREGSSRQKVFQYFANHHNGVHTSSAHPTSPSFVDDYVMNACDVMRSLIAIYPHGVGGSSIVRSGGLRGEDLVRGRLSVDDAFAKEDERIDAVVQKILKGRKRGTANRVGDATVLQALAEADGEAGISFLEWTLVDTLLSYEEADLGLLFRSFDLDGSGSIDAGELGVVLRTVLETADGVDGMDGIDVEHLGETAVKMLEVMNRQAGRTTQRQPQRKDTVDLDSFVAFCQELRVGVRQLHFGFYCERDEEVISAANLLTSIVSHCADIRLVDRYLDRIDTDTTCGGLGATISFETFQAMHDLVEDGFRDLLAACSLWCRFHAHDRDHRGVHGGQASVMTRDGFRMAVARLKGVDFTEAHGKALDALFWLFARDDSKSEGQAGELHLSDLNAALGGSVGRRGRHGLGAVVAAEGFGETKLQCVLQCFNFTAS